jgi:hypothetical protein
MIGTFAGGLVGKVIEKVLADTIEDFVRPSGHKHAKHHDHHAKDDVAAKLLETLAANGPRSIPQLLSDTHLSLSPVLHALQTLRDFRLVNFVGESGCETVEVTRSGADTVTVFRQNHIRDEAAKLLHA